MQVGPQGIGLVRRPGLPGADYAAGLRPRPAQEEQDHIRQVVGAERERCRDGEVPAAAASAGPVQRLVASWTARQGAAVSRDDLKRPQVVRGQTVDPGQHADPAAERQSGDADGGAGAAWHSFAVCGQPAVEVDEVDAGPNGDGAGPERHRVHLGYIEDQAARDAGPAAVAMAARPHPDREAELRHEAQAQGDVSGRLAISDARRLQRVVLRGEQFVRLDVAGLPRLIQPVSGKLIAKRVPVRLGRRRTRPGQPGRRRLARGGRGAGRQA